MPRDLSSSARLWALLVRRLFSIFSFHIDQSLIYWLSRYALILLNVSVPNISMVVRSKQDASTDKLGAKINTSSPLGIGFIPLEGHEKHWCDIGQLCSDIILVNDLLDFFRKRPPFSHMLYSLVQFKVLRKAPIGFCDRVFVSSAEQPHLEFCPK
jgi:hypothetical protein